MEYENFMEWASVGGGGQDVCDLDLPKTSQPAELELHFWCHYLVSVIYLYF